MNAIEKEILSFKEVLELLGISKSSLYKLTSSNKIPFLKPTNGKLYFKREQVLLWLTQDKSQSEQPNISITPNSGKNGN